MPGRDASDIPPPTYEEVIASTRYPVVRQSSVTPSGDGGGSDPGERGRAGLSRLKFVDFTPHLPSRGSSRLAATEFPELVQRANTWLQTNKHVTVVSCESVTWRAPSQAELNSTENVHSQVAANRRNFYMRGLRCWLVPRHPRSPSSGSVHSLDGSTETPGTEDEDVDTPNVMIGMRQFEPECVGEKDYRLRDLLHHVNVQLSQDPIEGRIISIETLERSIGPNIKAHRTFWTEIPYTRREYGTFMRIFYIVGQRTDNGIGLKDFLPARLSHAYQRYEELERVMNEVNNWLVQRPQFHLVNIQTVEIKRKGWNTTSERLSYHAHASTPVFFNRIFRLAYLVPRQSVSLRVLQPMCVMKKTFRPRSLPTQPHPNPEKTVLYETFTRTIEQVSAWLDSISGYELVSIETLHVCQHAGGEHVLGPEATYVWSPSGGKRKTEDLLTHVRVYLKTAYVEPVNRGSTYSLEDPYYIEPPHEKTSNCGRKCVVALCVVLLIAGLLTFLWYYLTYRPGAVLCLFSNCSPASDTAEGGNGGTETGNATAAALESARAPTSSTEAEHVVRDVT